MRVHVIAGLDSTKATGRQLGRPLVATQGEQRTAALLLYRGMSQLRVVKEIGYGVFIVQWLVRASRLASAAADGASSSVVKA